MESERLFETENPLEGKLGKKFFDNIPADPGVYRFYGDKGELLYVGKAKNLRRRLFTYRLVKSDHRSRKVIRLIRMTGRIEYEITGSEQQALIDENRLIRSLKPRFNRARKEPESYYYITVQFNGNSLIFDLRMHLREELHHCTYGAFKGHRIVRKATGGMLRLLSVIADEIESPFYVQQPLLRNLTPTHYTIDLPDQILAAGNGLQQSIAFFFKGESDDLLHDLMGQIHDRNYLDKDIGKFILHDMESMRFFFDRSARKNFEIKQKLNGGLHLISQDKLDDYLVELAFLRKK